MKRAAAAGKLAEAEKERLEKRHAESWHIRPAPDRHNALALRLRTLCARRPEIMAATLAETRDSERGAVRLLLGLKLDRASKGRFEEYKRDLVKVLRAEFPDAPEVEVEDLSGGGEVGESEYRVYP